MNKNPWDIVYPLRNGGFTRDRRMDRLEDYDPAMRGVASAARRGVIDLKAALRDVQVYEIGVQLDQGTEGACVAFAIAHAIAAWPIVGRVSARAAREVIYWPAQRRDQWRGGSYPGAYPRYEGTSTKAGAEAARDAGAWETVAWLENEREIAAAEQQVNVVVLGLPWLNDMRETDEMGFIHYSGTLVGGHAVATRGHVRQVATSEAVAALAGIVGQARARKIADADTGKRIHVVKNSWGGDWGCRGSCLISEDDLEQALRDRGDAFVPVDEKPVDLVAQLDRSKPKRRPIWKFWA